MSEEEKMAKLELNRYIYGKQLSKDDIADYLGILFNLIDKQQKEIEEKSTIIMAGAKKIKQLEKEIEELKLITREYNSYRINTDDETRIILAHKHYFDSGVFTSNFISKDKIREKLNQINDEYSILLSNQSLGQQNNNAQRYDAMRVVLEELLEEDVGDHIPRID